jgi:hypothetical protein
MGDTPLPKGATNMYYLPDENLHLYIKEAEKDVAYWERAEREHARQLEAAQGLLADYRSDLKAYEQELADREAYWAVMEPTG